MSTKSLPHLCLALVCPLIFEGTALGQTFYSQTVTNDRPLAYWNFDEPNPGDTAMQRIPPLNAANDLVPAFDATRVSHAAIGSGLFMGNTADFDGTQDNFNAVGLDLGLATLSTPWAVEFWMQLQTDTVSARNDYLIDFNFAGSQGICYDWQPDRLYLEAGPGSNQNGIRFSDQDTSWHHVALVYYGTLREQGRLDIYFDGVLTGNQQAPGNPNLALNQFVVGNYQAGGGGASAFFGRIDEVAIYDFSGYTKEAQLAAKVAELINDHQLASTVDSGGQTLSITSQPGDAVGIIGETTSFMVEATSSSGALAYQWQKNWVDIPGATNASYVTPALTASDAGTNIYRARVSSAALFANTREAVLAVPLEIGIAEQPMNVVAALGETASFSVVATSSPPVELSYQWRKNGLEIPGATNSSYTTPVLQASDAGISLFRVHVRAGDVFVDSLEATLDVSLTITITEQPLSVSASLGESASFSVVASSSPPVDLSYQWSKNGAAIPNATNSSYAIPELQLADVGTNTFKVVVSAGTAAVESEEVTLTVAAPPPLMTSYSEIVSADAPILYWNFDEVQGDAIQRIDVYGDTMANDLVPKFGASRVDHSRIGSGLRLGYAADFHGAGFPVKGDCFVAAAPDLGGLFPLSAYAIEFWVQLQPRPGSEDPTRQDYFIGLDNVGNLGISYDWESPDAVELLGGGEQRTFTNGIGIAQSDASWHHIVWVCYGELRSENRLDAYLDGVRTANIVTVYERLLSLLGPFTVGAGLPDGSAGMYGRMDEVAIYDFSTFGDEASLTSHVQDMVARHLAAALPAVLAASMAGDQLTLSWTEAGLVLQETDSLSTPSWSDVPGGGTSPVTVTVGAGNKYFSLRKP